MLAPRKKLWRTPDEAIEVAFDRVPLTRQDTIVDIGCGDGRVLLLWAKLCVERGGEMPSLLIGIDIEPDRIEAAKAAWEKAVIETPLLGQVNCWFHCANALECPDLWVETATVLFLYLIPRGLRTLQPLLTSNEYPRKKIRKVVSFMNRVPTAELLERVTVQTTNHQDTAWPLYIQELKK